MLEREQNTGLQTCQELVCCGPKQMSKASSTGFPKALLSSSGTNPACRGAILLDPSMEKCLLVRGWKKDAGWGFPRGKTSYAETDTECAIREVCAGTASYQGLGSK
jgi:hypothetical protein